MTPLKNLGTAGVFYSFKNLVFQTQAFSSEKEICNLGTTHEHECMLAA
jgi:hypothetical protein